jgi:hypothetical protein
LDGIRELSQGAGDKVTDIYFPTGAIVSLVAGLSSGEIIEAAMVGKDGVVGAFAALGGNIPINRGIVQLAGPALMCKVSELRSAVLQSQSLLSTLFRHEQTVYAQASQSAACMAPIRWRRDFADGFFVQEI